MAGKPDGGGSGGLVVSAKLCCGHGYIVTRASSAFLRLILTVKVMSKWSFIGLLETYPCALLWAQFSVHLSLEILYVWS